MVLKTQKSYCKAIYSTLVTSALNKIICNEQFGFSLKNLFNFENHFHFFSVYPHSKSTYSSEQSKEAKQ